MSTRYYHTPPPPPSNRVRCPVCHEAVYSRASIHPQCAVRQSERPEAKDKAKAAPTPGAEADATPGVAPTAVPPVPPLATGKSPWRRR